MQEAFLFPWRISLQRSDFHLRILADEQHFVSAGAGFKGIFRVQKANQINLSLNSGV